MIITRSWLEEFIDISKISTDEICKTLNAIGLEVQDHFTIVALRVVVESRQRQVDRVKTNNVGVSTIGERNINVL